MDNNNLGNNGVLGSDMEAQKRAEFLKEAKQSEQTTQPLNHMNDINSQDQVAQLQAQLNRLKNENNELKHTVDKVQQSEKDSVTEKDKKAMADIISGIPQVFTKHYSFPVYESEPIEFDIRVKPLSLIQTAQVAEQVSDMMNLTNGYANQSVLGALQMVAILKLAGTDYPAELVDTDRIYRFDILTTIYSDYLDWVDTFRQRQRF